MKSVANADMDWNRTGRPPTVAYEHQDKVSKVSNVPDQGDTSLILSSALRMTRGVQRHTG